MSSSRPRAAARKKRTPDNMVVAYVRMKKDDHKDIAELAEARGYPHTLASVAAEMISRGLEAWRASDDEILGIPHDREGRKP